jgi:hypothetical protein
LIGTPLKPIQPDRILRGYHVAAVNLFGDFMTFAASRGDHLS